jgi:hypothetical protein
VRFCVLLDGDIVVPQALLQFQARVVSLLAHGGALKEGT